MKAMNAYKVLPSSGPSDLVVEQLYQVIATEQSLSPLFFTLPFLPQV